MQLFYIKCLPWYQPILAGSGIGPISLFLCRTGGQNLTTFLIKHVPPLPCSESFSSSYYNFYFSSCSPLELGHSNNPFPNVAFVLLFSLYPHFFLNNCIYHLYVFPFFLSFFFSISILSLFHSHIISLSLAMDNWKVVQ